VADALNYDRSERKSWWSGIGLRRLLIDLNKRYPGRVRIFAHSMGNIVVSEALKLHGDRSRTPIVHSFVASQAASVAHAYDAVGPQTIETDETTNTPEVYACYPRTGLPYFTGMTNAVSVDGITLRRKIANYHNRDDDALNTPWLINQDSKPDRFWTYNKDTKRWSRASWVTFPAGVKRPTTPLDFPEDRYEIYAHIAEARSRALGAAERDGFVVRGQIGDQVNLNAAPFSYGSADHEHNAQARSIIMRRHTYWNQLLTTFNIQR
jgi:hypothetical protein